MFLVYIRVVGEPIIATVLSDILRVKPISKMPACYSYSGQLKCVKGSCPFDEMYMTDWNQQVTAIFAHDFVSRAI